MSFLGMLVVLLMLALAAPFAVSQARHGTTDMCDAMVAEAEGVGPEIVAELLKRAPRLMESRTPPGEDAVAMARLVRRLAEEVAADGGLPACYMLYALDIVLPQMFAEMFASQAKVTLGRAP